MEQFEKIFWAAVAAFVLVFFACTVANGESDPTLPPIEIARGLPSWEHCRDAEKLACWWHHCCEGTKAEAEALPRWNVWYYAEAATNPDNSERRRRENLLKLIHCTSWREVLTGRLPNPLP